MNHVMRMLFSFLACSLGLGTQSSMARVIPCEIVAIVGDTAGPSTITDIGPPFTNGMGQVGFLATLADGQGMIWNDGPVFFTDDALPLELTYSSFVMDMGIGNNGEFTFCPSVDGSSSVYTNGGVLMEAGWPMPPLPGLYSSTNHRSKMLPNGTVYWEAGTSLVQGGATSNWHIFKATDAADSASIVRVLGGGDIIDGKVVKTDYPYAHFRVSDNDEHLITWLDMNVALNEHVYMDSVLIAQEGDSTGQGDVYASFDVVGVSNDGDYMFTGATNGPSSSNAFVALNGQIIAREGDTLDGVTIPGGSYVLDASMNNLGQVAHMWASSTQKHFFLSEGPLGSTHRHIASVLDSLDIDGDGIRDGYFFDFKAFHPYGPGLDLADDGYVYFEADVALFGEAGGDAIVRVQLDSASSVADLDGRPRQDNLRLLGTSPNPARERSTLTYQIDAPRLVRVSVYDLLGRRIRVLSDEERPAGVHRATWDGLDAAGRAVPAGAYVLRVETGRETGAQKTVRVR